MAFQRFNAIMKPKSWQRDSLRSGPHERLLRQSQPGMGRRFAQRFRAGSATHFSHTPSKPRPRQTAFPPKLQDQTDQSRTSTGPTTFLPAHQRVVRGCHDVVVAAAELGALEQRLGYRFNDKLLGLAALKLSASHVTLKFEDAKKTIDGYRRLALLGDRVLDLALCRSWYESGRTRLGYAEAEQRLVTRPALAIMGRRIHLERSILAASSITSDMLAEAFEALIGAIYVDSNDNIGTVQEVLNTVGFKTVASSLVSPLARISELAIGMKAEIKSGSLASKTETPNQVEKLNEVEKQNEVEESREVEEPNEVQKPAEVEKPNENASLESQSEPRAVKECQASPTQRISKSKMKRDRKSLLKTHQALRAIALNTATSAPVSKKAESDKKQGAVEKSSNTSTFRSHADTIIPMEVEHKYELAIRPPLALDVVRPEFWSTSPGPGRPMQSPLVTYSHVPQGEQQLLPTLFPSQSQDHAKFERKKEQRAGGAKYPFILTFPESGPLHLDDDVKPSKKEEKSTSSGKKSKGTIRQGTVRPQPHA